MEVKIGDVIITLVDKPTCWCGVEFVVPKGTRCLVCEAYDDGCIMIETPNDDNLPFGLADYEEGEYEKVTFPKS